MGEYISNNMGHEIGWDDAIENDNSFVLLPEGDYQFTVTKFERSRHNGSEKLPPCNKLVLTIELTDGQQKTTVEHNLFMHSKCEGMLCEFFTAIGQRKHGEKLVPRWNQVVGSTGTCKVGIRTWTSNRTGETMQSNQIRRFYEKPQPAAAPQHTVQQTSFTPGTF